MSVSGDHAQPVAAGTSVHVSCSSGGGKPVPSFRWRVGDTEIAEHTETLGADLEVTSEITIDVEEEHDGAEIQCWSVTRKLNISILKYLPEFVSTTPPIFV